jgi:hypothetical protein
MLKYKKAGSRGVTSPRGPWTWVKLGVSLSAVRSAFDDSRLPSPCFVAILDLTRLAPCVRIFGSIAWYPVFLRHEIHRQKTHRFCVLGPFSWAIAHCFGVLWRFTSNMTACTFNRGMTIKIVVFAFMAIFVSYCPQFWGSEVIYKAHNTSTCLSGMTKNSSFLCFRVIFMSYCPLF